MPSRLIDPLAANGSLPWLEDEQRVIPFRPRAGRPPVQQPAPTQRDEPHRERLNILAFAVIVALMLVGAWVTTTLAHSDQSCATPTIGDCPVIYVPPAPDHYRPSLSPSLARG
jgi:hypothetical protein